MYKVAWLSTFNVTISYLKRDGYSFPINIGTGSNIG